jgi:hypothetical protein
MNKILFQSYCDNEYLLQKIGAYAKVGDENSAVSKKVVEYIASLVTPDAFDIPLADENMERAQLSSERLSEIDAWIKVGLKQIGREFPLVTGETIVRDRFTCLSDAFRSFPEGTPVLVRETNKATMMHFFPCSVYRNGSIEPGNLIPEASTPVQQPKPSVEKELKGPESIIISLFKGIASAIGEKIGAEIFNAIFPDNSSDIEKMLRDLQENIKIIFRQELDKQTIDQLNFKIQGVISYMQQTYNSQKKRGAPAAALEGILIPENEKMYTELMALLVGQRYRAQGIAYLVIGANAHLAILQELAAVTLQSKPEVSKAYTENYYQRLRDYMNALSNAISEVHQSRLDYLSPCQESTLKGVSTDHWWFVDNWANYTSESYYNTYSQEKKRRGGDGYTIDAEKKANHARDVYFNTTFHPTIVNDLQIYVDMKDAWANALRR